MDKILSKKTHRKERSNNLPSPHSALYNLPQVTKLVLPVPSRFCSCETIERPDIFNSSVNSRSTNFTTENPSHRCQIKAPHHQSRRVPRGCRTCAAQTATAGGPRSECRLHLQESFPTVYFDEFLLCTEREKQLSEETEIFVSDLV